jgi:predicted Zn-dependent protease
VQLFRRVGGRIYILTGTLLAADSVDYTAAVENVLASFQPSL